MPVDPEEAGRYFQPLEVEADESATVLSPGEARRRREARLLQSRFRRRINASLRVFHRKISRIHRAVPLPLLALFYLLLIGTAGFLLARPLLDKPQPGALTPLPPVPKQSIVRSLNDISDQIRKKNFAEALAALDLLETEYPNDPRILMTRGAASAGQREYPQALAAFQKAYDLAPSIPATLMNLAEIEFVMGHYAEAEPRYRKLHKLQPKNALILFRLYLCALLQKKPDEAGALLNSSDLRTQSLEWHYMRATDLLFNGKETEGLEVIQKARLLFGQQTLPYDKTLVRLGLIKDVAAD